MKKRALQTILLIILTALLPLGCGFNRRDVPIENAQYKWSQYQAFIDIYPFKIAALDASHIWVTDDRYEGGDSIFFYNGSQWSKQFKSEAHLMEICAASEGAVWALGRNEESMEYIVYFFNGSSWAEQYRTPSPLRDIICSDDSHAWAVGSGIHVYKEASWHQEQGPTEELNNVVSGGNGTVWACGENSVWFYDGSYWSEQYRTDKKINDMTCTKSGRAWLVSTGRGTEEDGAYWISDIMYFNGYEWVHQHQLPQRLERVYAVDSSCVWAWSFGDAHGPDTYYVYDGITWVSVEDPVLYNTNDISSPNGVQVWYTGGYG